VDPRGSRSEAVTEMMPLARYFVFVGGALMALLFAFDLFSPKAVADNSVQSAATVDKSTLRIKSEQKWPERIVFDTTQPTIVPKVAQTQPAQAEAALPAPAPEFTATARVRETFAREEAQDRQRPRPAGAGRPLQLLRQQHLVG
jgi:hypothetical protein